MWRIGIIFFVAVLSLATAVVQGVHAGEAGRAVDGVHGLQVSERLSARQVKSSNVYVRRLGSALGKYQAIARRGGWDFPEKGPRLELGSSGAEVARLRARLAKSGDIAGRSGSSDRFDDVLRKGVLHFQVRHGLKVDGIVGPKTRAALNISVQARMKQIEVNLRRWRSIPADLGRRYILVNVPSQELFFVDQDSVVFASPVIVGRAARPTPFLRVGSSRLSSTRVGTCPRRSPFATSCRI